MSIRRSPAPDYNPNLERNVLISVLSIISLVLCLLFILRCLKHRHRNRIASDQYPAHIPAQQNYYNTNSNEPPPYNWYSESPPPPYPAK